MRQQIGRHTTNHRVAKAYKILNEKKKNINITAFTYMKVKVKGLLKAYNWHK